MRIIPQLSIRSTRVRESGFRPTHVAAAKTVHRRMLGAGCQVCAEIRSILTSLQLGPAQHLFIFENLRNIQPLSRVLDDQVF